MCRVGSRGQIAAVRWWLVAGNSLSKCVYGLVFIFLLGLMACTTADTSWSRIQQRGTLIIGLDPTFPPFENGDTGDLHGFDVDLGRAIATQHGLTADFRYYGYDGLYDALATAQIDVLLSALVIDPTKTRDFAYTEPYFNAGQFLVVATGNTAVQQMADLSGHTLAVELGSEGHVQALAWQRRLADLTISPRNTPQEALIAVGENQATAALVDHVSGRFYRQTNPALTLLPSPVTVEPYALVVRADDQTLLRQLNDTLAQLEADGTLNQLAQTWLDGGGQ